MDRLLLRSGSAMKMARLGTALLLLLAGCADGDDDRTEAGPRADSGPADAAPPPRFGDERGDLCYDGADNDGDALLDCDDSSCTDEAVCCVGSATCCATQPEVVFRVPASCPDGAVSSCDALAGATPFGSTEPTLEGGGVVPQGGTTYGGVALGSPVDPRRHNIDLTATVVVPTGRCADCVDAAGVALFEAVPAPGERGAVRLGVLVNGARSELQVIVADRVVQALPLEMDRSLVIGLAAQIDGSAVVRGLPGGPITLDSVQLPSLVSPVVFGRTQNRASEPAINVTAAALSLERCDVPSAMGRSPEPVLPAAGAAFDPAGLGRITAVNLGDTDRPRVRVVFAQGGSLFIAGLTESGGLFGRSGPPDLILAPADPYVSFSDPWLVREADVVHLFVVAETTAGETLLLRADAPITAGALTFGDTTPVSLPPEAQAFDGPTVWQSDLVDGSATPVWHLIARLWVGDQRGLVRLVSSDAGASFELAEGRQALEASTVHLPSDDRFALDHDEVSSPALVKAGGVWRLYYAGRRGSRWSIGLLVSQTGRVWRSLGAVLEGDGSGFDALGVLHPAPVVSPDSTVELFYVGTSGSDLAIGRAGTAGD